MTKIVFDNTLNRCGLNRKDFAEKTGIKYSTVGKWNDTDRPIPSWVESWFENYIDKKKFENIKNMIKNEL